MNAIKNKTVLVGMSGGLDSTIAAYRLITAGYQVSGLFIKSWKWNYSDTQLIKDQQWLNVISAALGINIEILDLEDQFISIVINRYIKLLEKGLTPNPCILCNPYFKFKSLIQCADKRNINLIATGHYAKNIEINPAWKIFKGSDQSKDQSYMLCLLNQNILSRTLLPLGMTTKLENKSLAKEMGLDFSNVPESQDLCFVNHHNHKEFLNKFLKGKLIPGDIHDLSGRLLGCHQGLALYTIGQRKGIKIPSEKPYYVVRKDVENNILVIGFEEELGATEIIVNQINWISVTDIESLQCEVKIRYHSKSYAVNVVKIEKDTYHVKFNQNIRDVTLGQYAVFYNNNEMLGGGMISRILK